MANTLDAELYGITVANRAIEQFKRNLKPLTSFSTDFTSDIGQRNQSIVVPLTVDPAAAVNFDAGNGYTRQNTTVSETTVTLNKHKWVSWFIQDTDASTSNFLSLENIGIEKANKLATAVWQDVLSPITAANYGNTAADKVTIAAAAFAKDDVDDIALLCDNEEWPDLDGQRNLLLKPNYFRALLGDEITSADAYGSSQLVQNPSAGGQGWPLSDFRVHKVASIPANAENLVGFASNPRALAVAMRYLAPAGGGKPGSIYFPVSDSETGITMGYREFYDDDAGQRVAVLECWYGYAVGNAKSIKRIVSE